MADIKDLIEWTNDKVVMLYHDGPFDEKHSTNYLKTIIDDFQKISPLGAMAVVLKSEGKVIGLNSVAPIRIFNESPIELSYDISRSHWNKGYATEAARMGLRHIFVETEIPEIIACDLSIGQFPYRTFGRPKWLRSVVDGWGKNSI